MNFANRPRLRAALNYSRQVRNVKLREAGNRKSHSVQKGDSAGTQMSATRYQLWALSS